MPGKATGVEITYECEDCGQSFTVWQDINPAHLLDYQVAISLSEEHEDCEAND